MSEPLEARTLYLGHEKNAEGALCLHWRVFDCEGKQHDFLEPLGTLSFFPRATKVLQAEDARRSELAELLREHAGWVALRHEPPEELLLPPLPDEDEVRKWYLEAARAIEKTGSHQWPERATQLKR